MMEILQIIVFNGQPLSESLQRLFPGGDHKTNLYYSTYTAILPHLGDEHVMLLNQALVEKRVVHWSCGQHNAFDYIDPIAASNPPL
jgi:hypothetical protein